MTTLAEIRAALSDLLTEVYIPHHTPSSESGPEEWDVQLDAPLGETCERALRALASLPADGVIVTPGSLSRAIVATSRTDSYLPDANPESVVPWAAAILASLTAEGGPA